MLTPALLSLAVAFATGGDATPPRTYVANCGNTSYLDYRPRYWSGGCTGGSLNLPAVRWSSWSRRAARGSGTSELRKPCTDERGCNVGVYKARAKISLSQPTTCRDDQGTSRRYFKRARVSIRYREHNPFGRRPGWRTTVVVVEPDQGLCRLSSSRRT